MSKESDIKFYLSEHLRPEFPELYAELPQTPKQHFLKEGIIFMKKAGGTVTAPLRSEVARSIGRKVTAPLRSDSMRDSGSNAAACLAAAPGGMLFIVHPGALATTMVLGMAYAGKEVGLAMFHKKD